MPKTSSIEISGYSPGTSRRLAVHCYGKTKARPKVYIQAGIHSDELPANLVAHVLKSKLDALEAAGKIKGEIILVPVANPVGLDNIQQGDHQGRYHAPSGQNFNRGWPRVAESVAQDLAGKLGRDGPRNLAVLHKTIEKALGGIRPQNEAEALRLELMKLAFDADIVLDLHTDSEAEMHLYLDPDMWPSASDLAGYLGATVVMFARESGNDPFEETIALPYIRVREELGDGIPLPQPLTVVIELRGERDVSNELAERDADALVSFLTVRGVLNGRAISVPAFRGIAAQFSATQVLRAPSAGIIAYTAKVGTNVKPGDVVAEIVNPLATADEVRIAVKAETTGRFFARVGQRIAYPGMALGKIHGRKPLAGRVDGALLFD